VSEQVKDLGSPDAALGGSGSQKASRTRKWWGWGYEGEGISPKERDGFIRLVSQVFGRTFSQKRPPAVEQLALAPPRLAQPALGGVPLDISTRERVRHSLGMAYRDVVRALSGQIEHVVDAVVYPRNEQEIARVLEVCGEHRIAVIPYGGGTSVVGGIEPDIGEGFAGAVSLDLSRMNRVLEVDRVSRAARVEAGVLGPDLEDALRPMGLTLRHFPQSFALSTVGGWIATRAGGHFATLATHIDDLVESIRAVTPTGIFESRRLPASGAGPSPDRLMLGSEGALGVITEAWLRLQDRPVFRASASLGFADLFAGARAVRALGQSGLYPANCRLLDALEALVGGAGDGSKAVLLVAFESADHPVGPWLERALELGRDHGAEVLSLHKEASGVGGADRDPADSWRRSFLRAPYVRDELVLAGLCTETFETAITWDRFEALHEAVTASVKAALNSFGVGNPVVTCRFTHVYPDGVAPYFTVIAPAPEGRELAMWDFVKESASQALLDAGGTITHHHGIGRVHQPFYEHQRPGLFGEVLSCAKARLDPAGILNPGVIITT
jgi:alkyldihydroxyacetonephosphate synthase